MEIRSILCPVDFSEQSREALRWAFTLGRTHHAVVLVLHVLDPLLAAAGAEAYARETAHDLEKFVEETRSGDDASLTVRGRVEEGKAGDTIVEIARRENVDLIVIGTQGVGRVQRFVFGSVAERVLRMARVPVLSVPRADD
jgi:universal stress protein A